MDIKLHNCLICKHYIWECGQFDDLNCIHCEKDGRHEIELDEWDDIIVLGCEHWERDDD
jgi:hypothetical protein